MYYSDYFTRKYLFTLFVLVIFTFPLLSRISFCENNKGRWVHHQRQTPQHDIRSIYSLPDAKIWVDTDYSFHIFDGNYWQIISYDSTILGHNPPFIGDSKGRLYFVNTKGNLIVWDNGSCEEYSSGQLQLPLVGAFSNSGVLFIGSYNTVKGGIYTFENGSITKLRSGRTRSLSADNDGNIWATHIEPDEKNIRLLVFDGNVWSDRTGELESIPITSDLTVQTSYDGSIWVNNLGKYCVYRNGEWTFHNGGGSPMYLKFDQKGGVWGYGNSNLYHLDDNGNWAVSRVMKDGITNKQYFLAASTDSTVWTFDSQSIYSYSENDDEPWILIDTPYDLGSDIVTCLEYTRDGVLVCGHGLRDLPFEESEQMGVSILDDSIWYNYSEDKGTRFKNVYEFEDLEYGDIMVYTDSGFKLFDGDTWDRPDSLYVYDENAMFFDGNSILWIGTEKNGLIEYDFESYYNTFYPPVVLSFYISLYNIYVNTFNNIVYMRNAEWSILSFNATLLEWKLVIGDDRNVMDFVVDDDEFVWAARQHNLVKWNGEMWKNVISRDTNQEIILKNGRFIHRDEETGRIWASGYDNTGYLEDGIWHRILELSGTASDAFARFEDGRIAFNAFDEDRIHFYGVFEYYPDQSSMVSEEKTAPFRVSCNYPNPFNAITTITFELFSPEKVEIAIYNLSGQYITTIADGEFPIGINSVAWNAQSDSGIPMASGIYFYRIKSTNRVQTGKMLLLR